MAKPCKACVARLQAAPAQPEPASMPTHDRGLAFLILEACEARHGLRSNTSGGTPEGQPAFLVNENTTYPTWVGRWLFAFWAWRSHARLA